MLERVILESNLRVVVIGGGNAPDFARVIRTLPVESTLAVIAHCNAGPDAVAAALEKSLMPVEHVVTNVKVTNGRIFVVPSDKHVEVRDRTLVVTPKTSPDNTLDILLRSVADAFAGQTVGVILRGTGSNGSLGIKRIKEVGGITLAEAGATDTEMPHIAIATGMIDLVLPLAEIEVRLTTFGARTESNEDKSSGDGADTLRDILTLVRVRSGHDFASYKRATLFRRISRRMQVCQASSISEYHQYLRDHPGELANLLRDVLISVTNFMRDPDAFATLARDIIPKLFEDKKPNDQIRVWVPGCATGEEVYSLAMLMREHATRLGLRNPLQLFATDIDEEALAEARNARYPESIVVDLGPDRLDRFFQRDNNYFVLNKEVRETVLFSSHNLLRDPPFSRLDLISCRNLLIYLNREAQDRVLNLFHFALRPEAFLFLGASESAESSPIFTSVDQKTRVYQRRNTSVIADGADVFVPAGGWHAPVTNITRTPEQPTTTLGELHFRVVERYAPPSVLVDQDLDILHVSEHAGRFLAVAGGEHSKNLLRLVLPSLRLDLRTAIHAARQPGRLSETRTVRFNENGVTRVVEIRVVANGLAEVGARGILVLFDEKQPSAEPWSEPEPGPSPMEPIVREIEDELRRTRDQLRNTIEQYETSLEELTASNEELQAINEELRSTSEELETQARAPVGERGAHHAQRRAQGEGRGGQPCERRPPELDVLDRHRGLVPGPPPQHQAVHAAGPGPVQRHRVGCRPSARPPHTSARHQGSRRAGT